MTYHGGKEADLSGPAEGVQLARNVLVLLLGTNDGRPADL